MKKIPKYKSNAFEAIHTSAKALFEVGALDKATMSNFDDSCLMSPPKFEAAQIKEIREMNHVSQPVFARYLNTSKSTIQKWESGAKHPGGIALKLLSVVQKHGLHILD